MDCDRNMEGPKIYREKPQMYDCDRGMGALTQNMSKNRPPKPAMEGKFLSYLVDDTMEFPDGPTDSFCTFLREARRHYRSRQGDDRDKKYERLRLTTILFVIFPETTIYCSDQMPQWNLLAPKVGYTRTPPKFSLTPPTRPHGLYALAPRFPTPYSDPRRPMFEPSQWAPGIKLVMLAIWRDHVPCDYRYTGHARIQGGAVFPSVPVGCALRMRTLVHDDPQRGYPRPDPRRVTSDPQNLVGMGIQHRLQQDSGNPHDREGLYGTGGASRISDVR